MKNYLFKIEIIITVLQLFISTIFAALQFVPYGALIGLEDYFDFICIRRYIPMDQNLAGIFLQVDATILTLTIALVALISGLLSDSHMGISYSDYFLNIRPKIYKQIVIIVLSLIYFFSACICFWLQNNYLVAGALFCEILLVLMSSISIYGIFGGKEKIRQDIVDHSISTQLDLNRKQCSRRKRQFESDIELKDEIKLYVANNTNSERKKREKKYNKTKDKQDRFIDAFSKILIKDDKGEFEEYLNVFLKITENAWRNRNSNESIYDWETYM